MTTATTTEQSTTWISEFGPVPSESLNLERAPHEVRMYRLSTDRTKALGEALAFSAQFDSAEVFEAFVDVSKDEAYFTFEMKQNTRPLAIALRYKSDRWSAVESRAAHIASKQSTEEAPMKNRGVQTIYHAFLDGTVLERLAELLRMKTESLEKLLYRINFRTKTLALVAAEDMVSHFPEMESFKTAIIPKVEAKKEPENMSEQEESTEAAEDLNEDAAAPAADAKEETVSSAEAAPAEEKEATSAASAAPSSSASETNEVSKETSPADVTSSETKSAETPAATESATEPTVTVSEAPEAEEKAPDAKAPEVKSAEAKVSEAKAPEAKAPEARAEAAKKFEAPQSKSFDASPSKSSDRTPMRAEPTSNRSSSQQSSQSRSNEGSAKYHTYSQSEVDALIRKSAENITSTVTTKINSQTKAVEKNLKNQEFALNEALEKLSNQMAQATAKLDKATTEINAGSTKQLETFQASLNKELDEFKTNFDKKVTPGIKLLDARLEQLAEVKKQNQSVFGINPAVLVGAIVAIVIVAVVNLVISWYAFERIANLEKSHAELMLKSTPSSTSDVPIPDLMKEQIEKEQKATPAPTP